MTYITLSILLVVMIWVVVFIGRAVTSKEKTAASTLNKPLKNSNKYWYN